MRSVSCKLILISCSLRAWKCLFDLPVRCRVLISGPSCERSTIIRSVVGYLSDRCILVVCIVIFHSSFNFFNRERVLITGLSVVLVLNSCGRLRTLLNMEQTQATELQTAAALQPSMSTGAVKFMKDCISGTVGGVAVVAVGHPFGTKSILPCWPWHHGQHCPVDGHYLTFSSNSCRYDQGEAANTICYGSYIQRSF